MIVIVTKGNLYKANKQDFNSETLEKELSNIRDIVRYFDMRGFVDFREEFIY